MKALELDDNLSDVALLLQEQRYDEALSVLGDLMERHPADRETQMYRLLVARILVLRHSLSPTSATAESSPAGATSAERAFGLHKLARSFFRFTRQPQTSSADRLSETQPAESITEADKLRVKNNELLVDINEVSSKLVVSERTVGELQTMQNRTESENQQLHATNQELQQEIADIKNQLERSEFRLSASATQAQEITECNSKLQIEMVKLNQLLEARQKAIAELENERQRLLDTRSENQKLQSQNQQLQQEIVNVRKELQSSESRLDESARRTQRVADGYGRLQIELAELRQELEESQTKARALEAVQQELADVQSREILHRENQHKLEAQVTELQRELSSRREKNEELDATRRRLAEAENLCRELRQGNRRLEDEVSGSQERRVKSDEVQRQPSGFPQQLEETRSDTQLTLAAPAEIVPVANEEETRAAVWNSRRRRSRLETIPATAVIVIAAAVALGFLSTSSRKFTDPKEPVVMVQTISNEEPAASRTDVERRPDFGPSKQPPEQAVTALGKTAISKERPGVKPAPRARGMFKTTRETEVFNGPSENAALIASIRPGTKITVVDSRNGWLEIRSKTGRPPGFVRQDAAVRVDEN